MLSLTRKTDYALVALAKLADAGSDGNERLSVRQIAEEYSLPLPSLMNVFKDLQRAGFVHSSRGARGGYCLAARLNQINLISVIEAIEGPTQLTLCCEDDEPDEPCVSCTIIDHCPITNSMKKINDRITEFLSKITVQDLMDSEVNVLLSSVGTETKP